MAEDILDKLVSGTKSAVVEAAAKVAEIHLIKGPVENEFQRGYDEAARAIAAMIRKL